MTYFSAPGIPHDPENIVDALFKLVELRLGITKEQIGSKSRKRTLVIPRQIVAYILYRTGKFPLATIGDLMNRDHTTVIHSVRTVSELLEVKDPQLTEIYNKIKS